MRNHIFIILLILLTTLCVKSNCVFKVRLVHAENHKVNEIIVLNFQEIQPVFINDSIAIYSFNPNIPTNALILINRSERWHTFAWLFPNKDSVELTVDFKLKNTSIKKPKVWDKVFDNYNKYFDDGDFYIADKFAADYIASHRDSYLSLWLLSHGVAFHNKELKVKLFNLLDKSLINYKDYTDIENDLKNRQVPQIGQDFKEFALNTINGETFDSKTISQKTIVLHFWTNSCSASVKGMNELLQYYSNLDTAQVKLISICFDDKKEDWQKAKTSHKINWTNLWSQNGIYCELCLYYDLYAMPMFVVFNKDKKLQSIFSGDNLSSLKLKF